MHAILYLISLRMWPLTQQIKSSWRLTAYQFVLATSPLRLTASNYIFQLNTCGYSPYVTSSLIGWVYRLQLLLVLASTVILRSESRGTYDHILLFSDSRLPQPRWPGPRIYIPQEQDSPVIPPGTGFPFRRLLRLAGYSTPHPYGITVPEFFKSKSKSHCD
jgi:hypothetical protein